jgi:hypothetical protein
MSSRRTQFSPSMAVALVALVMAMSGGAYAATATSAKGHRKKKPTFAQQVLKVFAAHRTSFVGPPGSTGSTGSTGAPGPANTTTYYQAVTTTGSGGASGPGVVTLATIGPFSIIGKCTSYNGGSAARTYIRTTEAQSAVFNTSSYDTVNLGPSTPIGEYQQGGQNVGGDDPFGPQAVGTAASPVLQDGVQPQNGTAPIGPTTALSGDGRTRLILEPAVGSYVGAPPNNPACTFYGSIIEAS